jgi:DNA-binding transcriptional LysR family regulator
MQDPIETAELLAFSRVVDAKSLSRAAAELGVPRATISRRLARLEERLGTRLLRRTTRRQSLTEAGEAFYRHARIVLDAVGNAEASVRQLDDAVRGELRISVPPILTHGFHTMLCDFAARYPEVRLQVHFSTRHVDLQRDGYDIALRAGEIEPGLIARTLARMALVAVASPSYLEKHGSPRHVKDLKNHRCLLGFARGELPQTHWPLKRGGKLQVEGNLVSNEITLLAEAAVQGLGITLLPMLFVGPLIQSGQLVHVLPGVIEADARVALVYLDREYIPPHLKAFIEALSVWGRRELATGEAALQQMTNQPPPASRPPRAALDARAQPLERAPPSKRNQRNQRSKRS